MNRIFASLKKPTAQTVQETVSYAGESYWDAMRLREKNIKSIKVPLSKYQRVDALQAATEKTPPFCARMLAREFIHDSLYNPNYGYFSKKAFIFSTPNQVEFSNFKDNNHFMEYISDLYKDIEEDYHDVDDIARQVWHTPTEMFKPYYGYSVADYLIKAFDSSGLKKLLLYEIGAGNGTLMNNILDYIMENRPDIYANCKYNIVEISPMLANTQNRLKKHKCVNIINKSIFEWNELIEDPCFFLAFEDNFSHDLVRYDYTTNEPLQGMVLIDETGDYEEGFEKVNDSKLLKSLDLLTRINYSSPLKKRLFLRKLLTKTVPFTPNLTKPEFIPTNCFELIDILVKYFPNHRMCISDFSELDQTVPGINAPVVQTRYQGTMIPCSTFLVQPGWFDIFFPTNFELLKSVYEYKSGKSAQIHTQKDFLLTYSRQIKATTTSSGDNPMLSFYENFKFITS